MFLKFFILFTAISYAYGDSIYGAPPPPPPPPPPAYGAPAPAPPPPPPPGPIPPYAYEYAVVDAAAGLDFGASEESKNEIVSGSYNVKLADGRILTVTYEVQGDSGFVADVQYKEGAPAAAAPLPQYLPSYS